MMRNTPTTTRTILHAMAGITMTLLSFSPNACAEDNNVDAKNPVVSFEAHLLTSPAVARLPFAPVRLGAVGPNIEKENRELHRWKLSLVPLAASQALDMSSSWGMREMNPVLAGPDGRFGARAATVKLGVVGAFVGIEYLIVRKYPHAARAFEKINWAGAVVTTSFAAHNYMIR
jgi:hypothetical protein